MSPHKQISFIKSGIRIIGCIVGICGGHYMDFDSILIAFAIVGAAEILGIYEELGEK